jgi:dienelactone hydrolase
MNTQRIRTDGAITKTTLTLTSGKGALSAGLYTPAGVAKGLVVIAYGSDGLTDDLSGPWKTMIEGYAQALAEQGFHAVIPDYLSVTDTHPGPAVFDVMARHRDTWQAALSDATDQVVASTRTDPAHVGMLGFSLGGHLVLRLRGKARVLVEYFAPLLDGIGAQRGTANAQIHHGQADHLPGTGFANATEVAATLKSEGSLTELFAYPGAGHGFIGTDQANQDARDLSKARTLSFFQAHL